MKRLFLLFSLVAGLSTACRAQLYVEGTGGIGYNEYFRFMAKPGVGYQISDRWALGVGVGLGFFDANAFGVVDPYLRFNCWNNGRIYVDAKARGEMWFRRGLDVASVGIQPSLRYRVNPHWQVSAGVGLIGANYNGVDWDPVVLFTGTDAELGFIYAF